MSEWVIDSFRFGDSYHISELVFIRIYSTNLTCAPKSELAQIVHTQINIQRKITSPSLFQLCFKFLLYHKSKIQHLTSNLKPNIKHLIWIYLYIQIFSDTNIRSYHIHIIFLIRIYSDIHLYHFFYMNIFRYSFVLFFTWIYSDIRSYQKFIFVTPCFTLLLSFSKFHFHNLTFIISLSQFNFHNLTFTI